MAGTIENRRITEIDYCPNSVNGYEIINPIGNNGNYSDSYLCKKDGNEYMIKIYKFPLTADMENVLSTVKGIKNRSIAEIVDFGESENHAYEIQKYYKTNEPHESIKYFTSNILPQINGALYSLHSANIVHLDIKPENIAFFGRDIKILDFGISSFAGNEVIGYSENYSAPEVQFNVEVGNKADYYSLGITLFEIIEGYNPFEKFTTEQKNLMKETPNRWIPMSVMDSAFYELISGLTLADPMDRWGYAEVNNWIERNGSRFELIPAPIGNSINFNDKRYMEYELSDYLEECILAGEEGVNELFDRQKYDTYKIMNPWFAYLVYENEPKRGDSVNHSAIKLKVAFSDDNSIVIPYAKWANAEDLGADMLNFAIEIYESIIKEYSIVEIRSVYDYANDEEKKSFDRKIKEYKPTNIQKLRPEIWEIIEERYLSHYISNSTVLAEIKNEYELCVEKIEKVESEASERIFETPYGCIEPNYRILHFNYNYNNYQLIYLLAYMGYKITGTRSIIFDNEVYNSIDHLYDEFFQRLNYQSLGEIRNVLFQQNYSVGSGPTNPNPYIGMRFSCLINTFYDEPTPKKLIQPVLQALINISNGG